MDTHELTDGDWDDLDFRVSTIFKPASPVTREDLFSGRRTQLRKVVDAVNQQGLHAVLYGERGVGKTSLANMLFPRISSVSGVPVIIPMINCIHEDDYSAIWRRVFDVTTEIADRLGVEFDESDPDFVRNVTRGEHGQITPDLVRKTIVTITRMANIYVPVIDEFDTVDDFSARVQMADTLKFLSDRSVPATIVLVGVAEDIESLIDNHRSVERCLCQIPVPRMSRDEIEDIISTGMGELGMSVEQVALHEISRLAQGLPHYAHLLGLHSARVAIDKRTLTVKGVYMPDAIDRAIEDVQGSIKSDYVMATTSARGDALYKQVLLSAALAECDELGYFYPTNVQPVFSKIMGRKRKIDAFNKHLNQFCEATRAGVLEADERTARKRFRFSNPMLQPYVLIKGMADGLLTEEILRQTKVGGGGDPRLF